MKKEIFRLMVADVIFSEKPWEEIKKWRKAFKIKGKDVAENIKVSPSVISDYESGRRKSPGINMIKKILNSIIKLSGISDSYETEIKEGEISFEEFSKKIGGSIVVYPSEKQALGTVFINEKNIASLGDCKDMCIISPFEESILILSSLGFRPNFFVVKSINSTEKLIAKKFGFGVIVADIDKIKA